MNAHRAAPTAGMSGSGGQAWPSRLAAAADALGIELDAPTRDRLLDYLALLQRWNRTYNLTALREPDAMLGGHLIDCLAVLPALRRHAGTDALRVLDAGSGGGLPGVVIAIVQPRWTVVCVDAVGKKAGFIRQAGLELGLPNLRSVHARVQTLAGAIEPFDLIISRAFASLADFVGWTGELRAPTGVWVAMKARPTEAELAALPTTVEMFHVEPLTLPGLDAQRCLVWMRPRGAT